MTVPKPPRSLKVRGRKLWREITATFEFDAQEMPLLLEVCRTLDTIDDLSAAVEADGTMTTGSQGQKVVNPAVAELRQQQASFGRLLTMMNLDAAAAGSSIAKLTTVRAKTAANARWKRSGGQRLA